MNHVPVRTRLALATTVVTLSALILGGTRAPAAPANIKAVDGAGLKKAVAAHKGKVVVLNLWATWCPPCVAEFPDLVKLHNQFKSKGLVVIGASFDEPDDKAKVDDFITKQQAVFPVFLRSKGSVESFFDPIDKKWEGTLPTTYIFDKSGKLAGKPFVGEKKTYAEFVKAVEPLLK